MTGKTAIVFLRKAHCYSFEGITEPTLFYKTLKGEKVIDSRRRRKGRVGGRGNE